MKKKGKPSFKEAVFVLLVIVASIAIGVVGLKLSPNITILAAIGMIMLYAVVKRYPTEWLHEGIINGIKPGIIPIFIFILVGALIAVWIQAGIIPTLMVIGFKLISVKWFVPSVFVVCAIIGSAVGSAFTVMSTIGIAFFGIGTTLGINPALVVGSIVSGAVFGDKMSPLSESTNLAAAIVDADLFKHIKHMMWSTVPAFVVSFFLFMVLGHTNRETSLTAIREVTDILEANFTISFWSLIPLFLMLLCAWKKVPAILTILLNIAVAVGMIFIQNPQTSLSSLATVIESGFVATTGNQQIDSLLSRGGIESMMPTVSLIILTLSLGGLLIEFGLISTVMDVVSKKMTNTPKLIFTTLMTSIGVNLFIGEQFLSVILPGNAFKETYQKAGFDPTVLGRTLEDGGTVINYLVPWGIAGSFVASTFGIPTLTYLPFVFFSLLSPVFSMVSAFTGLGIAKIDEKPNGTLGIDTNE
ncbi:sodium:proton antiporter [Enterococcus hirae 57-03-H11]|uniref:Na+/H+ antiporter NhaC n=1 Tax=Enterococcus TaxID=1350 RepID=UPI000B53E76D|nr:Na+/H+ antiporter NhaC [Enterococcus hirae]OWW68965.1 sodium:proton antiporter [Enterococcus hirae 57-03-H11]EMF0180316.1 Na+/H+ antiporter NhaC [Enterococcus hirae]EMF0182655.1 Na+/H+ antiporter NhaC [Enterococcus hirae]EMF0195975.1 Na+/H+ antiporter NhaC [Enterococcus hirae]EMF0198128.1 Na+/H+ antiporter NhaC [Enterococcus hirae]